MNRMFRNQIEIELRNIHLMIDICAENRELWLVIDIYDDLEKLYAEDEFLHAFNSHINEHRKIIKNETLRRSI